MGGRKTVQVPHLRDAWAVHGHRRLVEPFCGGLAVTLGLQPRRALLNDMNPHIIHFYQWIKRGLVVGLPLENNATTFYDYRNKFNALVDAGDEDTSDAATLFYYLNRTGYNGLCRFNRQGRFNVPFGRYRTINYMSDFSEYARAFAHWRFTSTDAGRVPVRPDDFIYADLPYDVQFTQYVKGGFAWDEQVATAERLASHQGPVILTNQATDRIIDLYRGLGFELRFLQAPRMISCTGERRPAREVLASRNL